jgi:neuronal cell adhesion molecule
MQQQFGRGSLIVTKPRDEDLGQYQCFAENEFGIATSNSVFVRKAELNAFKDEPPKVRDICLELVELPHTQCTPTCRGGISDE